VSMVTNRKTIMILVTVLALVSLTVGVVSAAPVTGYSLLPAPVTQSINYQGKLTDAAGNPLTGTYTVTFKLYEASSGGTALATDTHTVQASIGLFTTQITANPSFFDGRALWLGIKVGADAEMTPRQEIIPVPYALSLRPGATILGDNLPAALTVLNTFGKALNVVTIGNNAMAIYGQTEGDNSNAIFGSTTGPRSYGVYGIASNDGVCGVAGDTTGSGSPGVFGSASGDNSWGVKGWAPGLNGIGVRGDGDSVGVYGNASGVGVHGVGLWGVFGRTTDQGGFGIRGENTNANTGVGVLAESVNGNALVANTLRADGKYAIWTDDFVWVAGMELPTTDVAEYMRVAENVTPGTVLVIGKGGVLQTSGTAYDSHVAGIVSTAPGVSLGTRLEGNAGEELIAVAGKVPCKVDASNGPILEGDLLTTSNNPGYAMKATNPQIGTILGKAMGSLESGTGTIEVLVTLQ